jgi:hypothetical protein
LNACDKDVSLNSVADVTNMHNKTIRISTSNAALSNSRNWTPHPVTSLVNRVLACAFELSGTKEVRLGVRRVGLMRNKDAALLLGAFWRERKYDDASDNLVAVTSEKASVKVLFTA